MRIAFVVPGSGISGGIRVAARLASGLLARGHDVRILYQSGQKGLRNSLRDAWLSVRYPRRQNWLQDFGGASQPYRTLRPELVGRNDAVIAVGVDCALAIADLPAECGLKVYECQGMEPWIMDRMVRAWHLPMPRIVAASYLEREMRRRGIADQIFVVPNGVDQSEYFPSVPLERRDGVGTMYHGSAAKDPVVILAVLWLIHERSPHTPLYVFGSFPRPPRLPPGTTYVRFPSVSSARDLYSRSLVWFCASRWEGFGLPLLEAMACGSTVVSTDCGGPADIVQDGSNGFLVPVGDVEALATRILQLLGDSALRARFVAASQELLGRFAWSAVTARFESVLRSIVARG